MSAALSSSGSETAVQLYAPYGGARYSSGALPTLRAFTGQYADTISGLYYYGARYYDPVAGQFTAADAPKGGQGPNRYAYVMGNPTTRRDPTGKRTTCTDPHNGCGSPPPPPSCGGVELSGTCWTLDQVYRNRLDFLTAYNTVYGKGWLQGEIDFVKWLIKTGRIGNSTYWTGVDNDLLRDMFLGAQDYQQGITSGQVATTQNWITFIEHPGMRTFWVAHNASIFTASNSPQGRAWYAQESDNEKGFINDALAILADMAIAQTVGEPGGALSGVVPAPIQTLLSICNPNAACLGAFADRFYPSYPTPDSWFNSPVGAAESTVACAQDSACRGALIPVIIGVILQQL